MSNYDPSDEDELTPDDLEYFKKRLQEERDKVLQRLARHRQEATNENTAAPDEMDQARSLADQAYLLRLAHKQPAQANRPGPRQVRVGRIWPLRGDG